MSYTNWQIFTLDDSFLKQIPLTPVKVTHTTGWSQKKKNHWFLAFLLNSRELNHTHGKYHLFITLTKKRSTIIKIQREVDTFTWLYCARKDSFWSVQRTVVFLPDFPFAYVDCAPVCLSFTFVNQRNGFRHVLATALWFGVFFSVLQEHSVNQKRIKLVISLWTIQPEISGAPWRARAHTQHTRKHMSEIPLTTTMKFTHFRQFNLTVHKTWAC